jgi:hypothetical protein
MTTSSPDEMDGFNADQLRNLAAAEGEQRERLIDRYRRRNQKRKGAAERRIQLGPTAPTKRNPSSRYGAGTGRGAVPSRDRIREADRRPTLLEQLRKDGSAKARTDERCDD